MKKSAPPLIFKRSPATKRTKREQSEESIDKLLSAARVLFVSKGYRATTLEQIASSAGMTKGAVYFHFGAKEAVLLKLLANVEAQVIKPALKILKSRSGSVPDKLMSFMRLHGEMGITNRQDLLLMIQMSIEFAEQTGDVALYVKRMYGLLYKPMETIIKRGQIAGEIRSDIPSVELTAVIVATHDGVFLEWYRRGGQLNGKILVRATLMLLLQGLGNK